MTATWKGSPNYTGGRSGKKIDRIVVHWIVGRLAAADSVFSKVGGTSAHYAVGGTKIHQYVREEDTAYHAGNWEMNQRSIGIEHEGGPDIAITTETYETSAKLIAEIAKRYNIPLDRSHIIKHSEVPRATQCPGTLDVDRLIRLAKGEGDQHADNLTKMLGADYIRDNQGDIFSPRLDIKDTQWGKIVIGKFEDFKRQLQESQTAAQNTKNELEREIRKLEDKIREIEGTQGVPQVPSSGGNDGANNDNNSGDGTVPQLPEDSTPTNPTNPTDPNDPQNGGTQNLLKAFISACIEFFKK